VSEQRETTRLPWVYRIPLILVLWAALGLLVAGLTEPMIRFEQFWIFSDTISLWSGTMTLLESGETFLGSIIMLFSILFPVVKNLWLLVLAHLGQPRGLGMTVLGALGKWSMLDVFVIAILIVSARMNGMTDAQLLDGLYYFVASILLVNLVSTIFTWAPKLQRSDS